MNKPKQAEMILRCQHQLIEIRAEAALLIADKWTCFGVRKELMPLALTVFPECLMGLRPKMSV